VLILGKILPRHLKILPIGFEALRVRGDATQLRRVRKNLYGGLMIGMIKRLTFLYKLLRIDRYSSLLIPNTRRLFKMTKTGISLMAGITRGRFRLALR
jgi:hypothetical protein